jgi:hypothetical protein
MVKTKKDEEFVLEFMNDGKLHLYKAEYGLVGEKVPGEYIVIGNRTTCCPIAHFRYIKRLTSIRGWDAETREITLRPKGIRRYFFGVQLHSIPASK